MSSIEYHFEQNCHSLSSARRGLAYLARGRSISSLLDVGAGVGTWLHAARELGISDVMGVDGVAADESSLHVERTLIRMADLRHPLHIGRQFDVVLCLEVAEHLPEEAARTLVQSVCEHGNLIFFSAAVPGQPGENHVNCQWPSYWQALFNERGFACRDDVRLTMWNDAAIEPWYRQNLFSAVRDPLGAGREPRILGLLHPEMIRGMDIPESAMGKKLANLEMGKSHPFYYVRLLARSLRRRLPKVSSNTTVQSKCV